MNRLKEQFKKSASVNGSYSVGAIVLVLCVVVLVNMLASRLPESVRKVDVSDNKIYEITDTSKKLLKKLDQKVTVTVYAEKSSTDERIRTFLNKYQALSRDVTVKWVDPVLDPAELTKNNVSENSIVVSCKDTGKSDTITFDEILVSDAYAYYTTGSTDATQFDGEEQLTSAINYVTNDSQNKVYYTTGHGESSFSTSVQDQLDKNNVSSEELNLLTRQVRFRDDCDLLIMNGISADLTTEEKDQIESYMKSGGDVMVLLGNIEGDVPNLDALLKEYGMQRVNGYIADMERCYQGNYYYIFPDISGDSDLMNGMSTQMVMMGKCAGHGTYRSGT